MFYSDTVQVNLWYSKISVFPNLNDPVQLFEKPCAFEEASLLGEQILCLIHKPEKRIQDIVQLM